MENNNAVVVDFKTWKNVELKKIKMAQLQITEYAHLLKANGINVADKGEIWIINENGIERINFKITTKLNLEWQDAKAQFLKNSANFKENIKNGN
ncbi:Dna2/Cas4 domain-containing protein [Spiroplasma endosymbiont of Megaselia nigra]|uniref:Dna2/Cas4 domain-containing protein n=1 Tax=Spiroplasma endosymbiont of Megaselia nigra TaxID=2478537 RepID=UPI000F88E4A9|nr:Dna2/Cas4 domain-containing protein [Spiroplasma endosymbiont of Megaselia nigra]RUO86907.1 Dna2/Cas4 domain-containing protein [Spiroplasma endosymbiont of Megaselia nigra]